MQDRCVLPATEDHLYLDIVAIVLGPGEQLLVDVGDPKPTGTEVIRRFQSGTSGIAWGVWA